MNWLRKLILWLRGYRESHSATVVSENARGCVNNIDVSHAVIEAPSHEAAVGIAYMAANRLFPGKISCKVTPLDSLVPITRAEDARLS